MCDYKTKYKLNLEQHIETAHTKVEHKCDQCDYKFTRRDNLRQHVKAVHEGINHQCEYCSHKASTPNNLRQHVKSVHAGIKYCDYCNYKASDPSNLSQHIKSVHERIKYDCTLCDYKASLMCQLQLIVYKAMKMLFHTSERVFICISYYMSTEEIKTAKTFSTLFT